MKSSKRKASRKFVFHILCLPHTEVTREYSSCAYTSKILNFCHGMSSLGHKIFLYGAGSKTTAPCHEFVPVFSPEEQAVCFGYADTSKDFFPIEWNASMPYWQIMVNRSIQEIGKRIGPNDFILASAGLLHKPVADAFPMNMTVEPFVGYEGVFSNYIAYESYAHMHYVSGLRRQPDGHNYQVVVPGYINEKDFPRSSLRLKKEDYFLFVGRLVSRKGILAAVEACRTMGCKLKIAGQGVMNYSPGKLTSREFTIEYENMEYLGTVSIKERNRLMSRAKGLFCLTDYFGPFETVHIEALASGCPVITTDHGVFSETVLQGKVGYRCRSLDHILWAMNNVEKIDPAYCRTYAIQNFGIERVKFCFQEYFEHLFTLKTGRGWYELNPDRTNLDWLSKYV